MVEKGSQSNQHQSQVSAAVLHSLIEWGDWRWTSKATLHWSTARRAGQQSKTDRPDVALKIIDREKLDDEEWALANSECVIHRSLPPHPNVVPVLSSAQTDEKVLIVMPLAEGGDFWERIQYGATLCELEACNFASQLFAGLDHLHQARVVHADIKPQNMLLSQQGQRWVLQLCDFGLAQQLPANDGEKIAFTAIRGTAGYISPEVCAEEHYDEKIDIFSAGLVLFRLMGGYEPFYPAENFVEPVEFEEECWQGVSEQCKNLIQDMLRLDPEMRPSAAEALRHPWITGKAGQLVEREVAEGALTFYYHEELAVHDCVEQRRLSHPPMCEDAQQEIGYDGLCKELKRVIALHDECPGSPGLARSKSKPNMEATKGIVSASDIFVPGGFRREFIHSRSFNGTRSFNEASDTAQEDGRDDASKGLVHAIQLGIASLIGFFSPIVHLGEDKGLHDPISPGHSFQAIPASPA